MPATATRFKVTALVPPYYDLSFSLNNRKCSHQVPSKIHVVYQTHSASKLYYQTWFSKKRTIKNDSVRFWMRTFPNFQKLRMLRVKIYTKLKTNYLQSIREPYMWTYQPHYRIVTCRVWQTLELGRFCLTMKWNRILCWRTTDHGNLLVQSCSSS